MPDFKITTPRLRLREFAPRDAQGFYIMNATPEVLRYTGDEAFASPAAAEQFIRNYDHYQRHGYGRWTVERRSDGAYLGFCGLKYHSATDEVDLGYRIGLPHWGQGYATEAAMACIIYAFEELGLERLIGRVQQANVGSIRVLEKVGMQRLSAFDFEGAPGWVYECLRKP